MKRIIGIIAILLVFAWQSAVAQKTCVIASAEDHVPIREALIHTDNNHWARTDYRGYFTMRYQFDSATVSKPGYIKATIYLKNLPDTVFLLPQAKQIGEVTIWGNKQENINGMLGGIQKKISEEPHPASGVGFDAFGWMDKRGNRDRKHLKQAKKIFQDMDKKDPIVSAYEEATGKKYQLQDPHDVSALKKEEENADGQAGEKKEKAEDSEEKKEKAEDSNLKTDKKRNPIVEVESTITISK